MQASPRQVVIELRRFLLWNWLASRLLVSVVLRCLLVLWLLLALWRLLVLLALLAALLLRWQLNVVDQDARAGMLDPVLLPLVKLECPGNCNRSTLGDVLRQLLGSLAKHLACDPASFLAVAVSSLDWQTELSDGLAAACVLYFHRLAASA